MTRCPNCNHKLKIVEETVKFAVQLGKESKEEDCCEMPKRIDALQKKEESPLDLCANCNHSRFDHTEKGEPIPCSYGGKGCGCNNFVETKEEVKKE